MSCEQLFQWRRTNRSWLKSRCLHGRGWLQMWPDPNPAEYNYSMVFYATESFTISDDVVVSGNSILVCSAEVHIHGAVRTTAAPLNMGLTPVVPVLQGCCCIGVVTWLCAAC